MVKAAKKEDEVAEVTPKKKGGIYAMFETDAKTESSGIVINYGDFKVRVARAGGENKRYVKILRELTKPYQKAIDTDTIDPEVAKEISIKAFVRGVLLGWEGVTDRDGNALAYNEANAIKVFTDLPEFFKEIAQQALNFTLFRAASQEDEAKN